MRLLWKQTDSQWNRRGWPTTPCDRPSESARLWTAALAAAPSPRLSVSEAFPSRPSTHWNPTSARHTRGPLPCVFCSLEHVLFHRLIYFVCSLLPEFRPSKTLQRHLQHRQQRRTHSTSPVSSSPRARLAGSDSILRGFAMFSVSLGPLAAPRSFLSSPFGPGVSFHSAAQPWASPWPSSFLWTSPTVFLNIILCLSVFTL